MMDMINFLAEKVHFDGENTFSCRKRCILSKKCISSTVKCIYLVGQFHLTSSPKPNYYVIEYFVILYLNSGQQQFSLLVYNNNNGKKITRKKFIKNRLVYQILIIAFFNHCGETLINTNFRRS